MKLSEYLAKSDGLNVEGNLTLSIKNTKEEKFDYLGNYIKGLASEKGVFHIRRKTDYLNQNDLQNLVMVDLFFVRKYFDEVLRQYSSFGIDEINKSSWFTMTLRLKNETIVSYFVSTGSNEKVTLKIDYSVRGSVIEYDDAFHKAITQTSKEEVALQECFLELEKGELPLFHDTESMIQNLFEEGEKP